jgi:hypothetical protein
VDTQPVQEPGYEPLSPGKRGLLIALLYHLKDRCGLELQDIAAPARSVSINDYCRRAAPKAEPAIFRGVYRTAKAHPEALAEWARAAFASLYGEDTGAKQLDRAALLAELFPHAIREPEALERLSKAYRGVYALYHYRLPRPDYLRDPGVGQGDLFDRLRLEVSMAGDQSSLQFRITQIVESFGRTPFYPEDITGQVLATAGHLYLIGSEETYPRLAITILPFHLQPPPSFLGMMLKSQSGLYAFRILAIRAPEGQEDAKKLRAWYCEG